jgi:hypothetical protein
MANRYWVGGTATWDATAGSKWALTTGGAGGQAVPTSSDTVFFDANSGANTVTIGSGTSTCSTLTMTGFTGTLAFGTNSITCAGTGTIYTGATTFSVSGTPLILCTDSSVTARTITATAATEANSISFNISAGTGGITITGSVKTLNFTGYTGALANSARTVYGNLTLGTGMSLTSGANATSFSATSGTQILTSNAVTSNIVYIQNGVGGTVQLADAMSKTNSNGTYTLTNGTFNANNFNVSVFSFSSSNSNTRTLTMGSGTWSLVGGNQNTTSATVWDLSTTTNLTFNKNTANISLNGAGTGPLTKTFNGGGLTYNNLTMGGGSTVTGVTISITGSNTFATFNNNKTVAWTLTLQAGTTTTVTSWSITNGSAGNIITINSSSAGSQATISQASGTISASYYSIQDSNATGGASWQAYTSNNNTDAGNNTGWLFTAPTQQSSFFLLFA